MSETSAGVQNIRNNLDKIAYAVTSVLKKEIDVDFKTFFDSYYEKLKDCKFFIFKDRVYYDKYEEELDELFTSLKNIVGYDIKKYYFNRNNIKIFPNIHKRNKKISYNKEIIALYEKEKNIYNAFSIDLAVLCKVYDEGGMAKVSEIKELINKINKKTNFYRWKTFWSSIKEGFDINKISGEIEGLCKKYKINSINDLLSFNTEIDSFFVDVENMNDKQKMIIESNKKKFRSRIDAKNEYDLPECEAKKLKKKIEKIFDSNVYDQMITYSNLSEMLEINNIKLNDVKLKEIVYYYIHLTLCNACAITIKVNGEEADACFFKDSLLKSSELEQNSTLLHECIHLLQARKYKGYEALSVYCKNMTEAITEYFAIKATGELRDSIFTCCDFDSKSEYVGSAYCCMLPLVEELLNSDISKDIIDSYIYNGTNYLVDKIGGANVDKIRCCFDNVFERRSSVDIEAIVKYNVKVLRKVITNIKKSKRNNVK